MMGERADALLKADLLAAHKAIRNLLELVVRLLGFPWSLARVGRVLPRRVRGVQYD